MTGAPLQSAPDVVIVGAGAAGMGGARRLRKAGHSVLIVEAAGRVGEAMAGRRNALLNGALESGRKAAKAMNGVLAR